jgi:arylsulfatase A-like enzyme
MADKTTIVRVDDEIVRKIEALQTETRARQDLIAFMLDNGASITGDQFSQYHSEYIAYHQEYEKAKQELQDKYIPENSKRWNLDFATGEVTIYA